MVVIDLDSRNGTMVERWAGATLHRPAPRTGKLFSALRTGSVSETPSTCDCQVNVMSPIRENPNHQNWQFHTGQAQQEARPFLVEVRSRGCRSRGRGGARRALVLAHARRYRRVRQRRRGPGPPSAATSAGRSASATTAPSSSVTACPRRIRSPHPRPTWPRPALVRPRRRESRGGHDRHVPPGERRGVQRRQHRMAVRPERGGAYVGRIVHNVLAGLPQQPDGT